MSVTRRRKILLGLLIPTLLLAVWQWFFRPYAWRPDPDAACRIEFAQLRRDRDYHWLDLRLEVTEPGRFRIDENLALLTASAREIKPAGLTLEGAGSADLDPGAPALAATEALALRFWMEPGDFDGPLQLRINGASLHVRRGSEAPSLEDGETEIHRTCRW